jgi:1-pyrroline-5-carboxylate dehydrogenase
MTFRVTYSVLDADLTELNREFDAAVVDVRKQVGTTLSSWIAGKASNDGEALESLGPTDRRVLLSQFHSARVDDIDRAVTAAHAAQKIWAALSWKDRVAKVRKAADAISNARMKLAAVMCLEVGKTRLECLGDVEEAADLLRYYAQQVEDANGFARPLGKLSPNEDTRDVLRPYGVFAVVSPFNFPLALAAGMSSAALLGGNAVILKPSEEAPWCADNLYRAFAEADLPAGLFQILHGRGEDVGAALVRHRGIDGVAFTGSTHVGLEFQRIMSTDRIRPCLLEMGGKNGTIVGESADLDTAVEGCVRSSFGLSGQKCSALSRIYVAKSRHREFLEKMIERTKKYVVGDPAIAGVDTGPVINDSSVERFERAVADAKKDGTVHIGGEKLTGSIFDHGSFVAPTIVTVPRGHRLVRDELFLPFVTLDTFDSIDDGLALLNDSPYGLTAGVFSQNEDEIERFMNEADAGILYANRKTGATTGAWPGVQSFCGWKASGSTGKGGCGPYYVSQFAREQSQTRMSTGAK